MNTSYDQMEIQPDSQFLYEWEFNQDEEDVDLVIKYPPTFNPKSIKVEFTEDKKGIKVHVPGLLPIVCGHLGGSITGHSTSISSTSYTITMTKETPIQWLLLTDDIHPTENICDPMTSFFIATALINNREEQSQQAGLEALTRSALWGFMPAVRAFVRINLNSSNENLSHMAVALLQKASDYYGVPDMQFWLGMILYTNDSTRVQSLSYFSKAAEGGVVEARSRIGQLLSPLSEVPFETKDASKASQILEAVLQLLPDEPIALSELSKLLYNGVGVELNEERAKELHGRLKKIVPEAPDLVKQKASRNATKTEDGASKSFHISVVDVVAAASILLFISVGAYSIYRYFRRRK
ncbi:hypothetical protein TRFO_31125 [Tritrichomonas foetus]|uniref:CS domain-containing protein n=1 Tax=Tritrichomonas foetus TaxID=1144522 RepID=A0A1J4JWM5_9EUKA|nr:hypothetical protein TRFO_31125 [Tritrichomonas foetus]|eukprot:OHT01934.1 hypothetical protein TRFO_31125 [Tritrichomonas foetus]